MQHSDALRGSGRGILAIVLASLLWGTTGTAASFVPDAVPPVAIGATTFAGGGILLVLLEAKDVARVLSRPRAAAWLGLGAVGVVSYALCFYASMHLAGVAIGNVVSLGSGPVFAAVLEAVVDRRRPGLRWIVATSIAIAGIGLLAASGDGPGAAVGPGVALGLVAGLSYALYTFASARVIADGGASGGAMGAMFGMAAVPLAVVAIVAGGGILGSGASIGIAAYLAIGPMALAYVLFGIGLRVVRSSVATTITLLEPVVATVLAVVVVGERPAAIGWVGLALVLGAIVVLVTGRRAATS